MEAIDLCPKVAILSSSTDYVEANWQIEAGKLFSIKMIETEQIFHRTVCCPEFWTECYTQYGLEYLGIFLLCNAHNFFPPKLIQRMINVFCSHATDSFVCRNQSEFAARKHLADISPFERWCGSGKLIAAVFETVSQFSIDESAGAFFRISLRCPFSCWLFLISIHYGSGGWASTQVKG